MSFFSGLNIAKYIFRLFHIAPLVIVGGKLYMDNLFPYKLVDEQKQQTLNQIFDISAILLTIAGFINIFLLKASKAMGAKTNKKAVFLWKFLIYIKFASMIYFCDYLLQIVRPQILEDPIKLSKSRFHIFNMWIVLAPFMRFWREHYTKINQEKTKQN